MSFYDTDPVVERIGEQLVQRSLKNFAPRGLDAEHFSVTLLLHDGLLCSAVSAPVRPRGFGYRSSQPYYPCSVVKLFYLVAAQARLAEGFIRPHEELDRAMRDMILYSSNTATNYVIDLTTETTGDTLLPEIEMTDWMYKRNWVNRFFQSLGWPELEPINVCQKLMDDQRYGRERMFAGADGHNHNRLTTDATARLFYAIFTGSVLEPDRARLVAERLARPLDPDWVVAEPNAQVLGYFGEGLPKGTRLWSKAGCTTWTGDPTASYRRHDAAYVELPGGKSFTLVVFTEGKEISAEASCLPGFARVAVELVDRT
ncbi:MAG TPA: serine hydrolase [Bradyrhizobium sp.]|nr:serine hydrolase [Bradyrhizobium sp.]